MCEGARVEVRECEGCGLGYSTPRPTESHKIERYREWARQENRHAAEAHYDHRQQLRHFHLYLRVLRELDRSIGRGRILDVGVAGGLFPALAAVYASEHNAGIRSRYQPEGAGFDPGEVELARKISGVPIHGPTELRRLEDGRYDGVTLLNVLEHVNEPVALLTELRRLLRRGGVLILVVPNNEAAFWKLRRGVGKRPESLAASEHLLHFRPAPLERLLRKCGFGEIVLKAPPVEAAYGSLQPIPARQRTKQAVCDALRLLSGGLWYLYSEIFALARRVD